MKSITSSAPLKYALGLLIAAATVATLTATNELAAQPIPVPDPGADTLKKGDGWLGVSLTTIVATEAARRGYKRDLVAVETVFENSPASSSGFLEGDAILELNGTPITDVKHLVGLVRGTAPGTPVKFKVLRGKEVLDVPLLLALRPDRMELVRTQLINKPAPDFKVAEVASKKTLSLTNYRGKVVILDFWATWCGPCRRSIPELNAIVERHKGQEFALIGISDEDKDTLKTFLKTNTLTYTVASDPTRQANKDYLVNALPTTFLIDQDGVVREVFVGSADMKKLAAMVDELLGKPL